MNSRLLTLLCAAALLVNASCVVPPYQVPAVIYRAYEQTGELSPAALRKLAELEKSSQLATAPGPITEPVWTEVPRPFSIELRRGREKTGLSITMLVLVDAKGKTLKGFVVDATDDVVAKQAEPIILKARYVPGKMAGNPVACATLVQIDGAGVPR
ncbi:MAG: hypothetical protein RLZZ15_1907 [Verrucomicrobiota bacterium]|jgi:hypothetical protein